MAMTDPVGDLITRIRNAQMARLTTTNTPASNLRAGVLDVLKREGYIVDYKKVDIRSGVSQFEIELKYSEGQPVIREIKRVSKPGCRVYKKIKDLPREYNGLGISIISTPRGVMSDAEARGANVGGEVLCSVY